MPTPPATNLRRVLVTGATGLLGSSLVPILSAAGHDVVTTGRSSGGAHPADLRDPELALKLVEQVRPDTIVNLAAATNVDECERDPQAAYSLNVLLVENLVRSCAHAGASIHLLQLSTDHVYDADGANQEHQVTVRNQYAMSKIAGEHAALRAPGSTVLRVNFVGRSHCPGRSSFSDWVVDTLRSGHPLTVFEDVWFSPLRIETLALAISRVIAIPAPGVFNLGARGATTKAALARDLASGLQLPVDRMQVGSLRSRTDLVRRPTGMAMDSTRFGQTFNFALPSIEDELADLRLEYLNAV